MQAALHSPKYLVLEVCVHAGARYCPATSLLFYPGTGACSAGSTPYPCSRQAVQLGLSVTDGRASWALGSTTKFYMQGPIRKEPCTAPSGRHQMRQEGAWSVKLTVMQSGGQ